MASWKCGEDKGTSAGDLASHDIVGMLRGREGEGDRALIKLVQINAN